MVPVCDKRYHIYNRFRHFGAEIKKLWNYPFLTVAMTYIYFSKFQLGCHFCDKATDGYKSHYVTKLLVGIVDVCPACKHSVCVCVYNDADVQVLWTVELKVSCMVQDPLSDVIAAFTPDRDCKFTPHVVVLDQVYITRGLVGAFDSLFKK